MPDATGRRPGPGAPPVGEQPKIDGVTHIVAVASAKGGVGKSTVAVNLAAALRSTGRRVGYADLDIYGPSAPVMLGATDLPMPDQETRQIGPIPAHGLKVISMGLFLDDEAPVIWRGPMAMSATKQFLRGVAWGELDYLIVDLPPGTGDIPLTMAQEVPIDGAVIVTTPQDVAMVDVERGVAMFRKLNTPILGVVDNMAGFVCPDCGTRDDLFGSRSGDEISRTLSVPLLAEIPIVQAVREAGDAGTPIVVADPSHPVSAAYAELAAAVEASLAGEGGATHSIEPVEIRNDEAAKKVHIRWNDETETHYSYSGLRGWCPCAQCQGHAATLKFVVAIDPLLASWEGVGRYAVRFLWEDGHGTGMYTYEYLREIADYAECTVPA